ncbi:hypothetical protein BS50DRAFT_584507 [Corynespora cassiicola Philippines]|uniref:Uncharacterized protein n=1 Tax=Corynespora cassiicola Philippines TaxID=1448308 RepID=A0A2T2NZU7_CORCC|nr:hypothetical protein BS50DRAFT_584507 [Corynespora cassiicola Philippines]
MARFFCISYPPHNKIDNLVILNFTSPSTPAKKDYTFNQHIEEMNQHNDLRTRVKEFQGDKDALESKLENANLETSRMKIQIENMGTSHRALMANKNITISLLERKLAVKNYQLREQIKLLSISNHAVTQDFECIGKVRANPAKLPSDDTVSQKWGPVISSIPQTTNEAWTKLTERRGSD